MRHLLTVAMGTALMAGGCRVGLGNTQVGELGMNRPAIDHRVCLEDAAGGCGEIVVAKSEEPARAHQGVTVIFPAVGAAWVKDDGPPALELRGEGGLEYLRGRGRVGYGVRASAIAEGANAQRVITPVMGLAHVAVSDRLTLHGGLGYAPYARLDRGLDWAVVRGAVGGELVLSPRRAGRLSTVTELDTLTNLTPGRAYRTTGLTTSLALRF